MIRKPAFIIIFTLFVFEYRLNLHYSQTEQKRELYHPEFEYRLNLHYSQTHLREVDGVRTFEYRLNLHYSQTQCNIIR